MTSTLWIRRIGSSFATALFATTVVAGTVLAPGIASAVIPVPTDCIADRDGANFEAPKTDLTLFCANTGDGSPFELSTIINYDWINAPSNGSDSCVLFDTDNDAFANLAVCVTLDTVNNQTVIAAVRLFVCNDTKADRCSGNTLLAGPYTTTCQVSQQNTDPFPPPAPGPGEAYPADTEVLCGIDLDDFGGAASSAVLQDACSYSSSNPNANPQDCIAFEVCSTNADCDDNNDCTTDTCDATNVCNFAPSVGTPCTDGLYCNGEETCTDQGLCGVGTGTPVDCSDNVDCTLDTCDELTDSCDSEPMNSLCSDGEFCTGVETCDSVQGCLDGEDPTCDDFIACTTDSCNEDNDNCDFVPDDGDCDNGAFCDGAETCDGSAGCVPGTPPNCSDNVDCTTDDCDETTDQCTHAPSDALCDDDLFCDGTETCDGSAGCVPGTPIVCNDNVDCTDDACNEAIDDCLSTPNDENCDNGVFCDGAETCSGSAGCVSGTPVACNDGISCTSDSCNEANKECDNLPNNASCGDNNDCNGIEVCNPASGCEAGSATNCDDGIACTVDTCDTNGDCVHTPSDALCSDGAFCTGEDTCIPGQGCAVGPVPDCDDGVECTTDSCDEEFDECVHTNDSTKCDNGDFCDGAETCNGSAGCVSGTPVNCNDGVACTTDNCNEATDSCDHANNDAACDNETFCDGAETCQGSAGCVPGTPPSCSDNVDCTIDACDAGDDECTHTSNNASCDNGDYCDGAETCAGSAGCVSGTAPDCNDNVDCTTDSCDEATDSCDHAPDNGDCSDGAFCTGVEICNPSTGCESGADPCPDLQCDEDEDQCFGCSTNAECDNGVFCDGAETCSGGFCTPGTTVNCDDNVDCTIDSCDEQADECVNTTSDAFCDNNLFCDGTETCNATLGCQAGTNVDCDDNVTCTNDSCDEATDTCVHPPSDALCDNDTFCDGTETCDPLLDCQPGTAPDCDDNVDCTDDSCSNQDEQCEHAANDSDCDNGQFCDGAETCNVLTGCQAGTPPSCDDGVACTQDSCYAIGNVCQHASNNAACDNGQFCDGAETCNGSAGCASGVAPNCNDNVDCTNDSCDEATDQCAHDADDDNCDDDLFCTGHETCDALLGCQAATNVDCNDNVDCTTDSCNEATDQCDNVTDDTDCDNGDFCDGAEVCDKLLGCQPGTEPDCNDNVDCTTDSCDEADNTCLHTPHDALCDDALFCDGAETCQGSAGCVSGSPPNCNDNVDCTTDACNEGTDMCDHTADNTKCDNGLFCDGTETCNVVNGCVAGNMVNCADSFICSADSCDESSHLCLHDMTPCVCGDMEVTGEEACDPPVMAGTFEDCNDDLDNDGDGKIDCRDPDCKPGARDPLCDESCTEDQVCLKFIRDPARILFNRQGPDEIYIHGRIPMEGDRLRAAVHAITFELSNGSTPIYRAVLDPGDMRGGVAGKRFRFTDRDARVLGELSSRNGLERVWVRTRRFEGVRYLVFTVRAWGDFSKARDRLMTTELSVGPEVGFLTQEWNATPRGWILHQKSFDD